MNPAIRWMVVRLLPSIMVGIALILLVEYIGRYGIPLEVTREYKGVVALPNENLRDASFASQEQLKGLVPLSLKDMICITFGPLGQRVRDARSQTDVEQGNGLLVRVAAQRKFGPHSCNFHNYRPNGLRFETTLVVESVLEVRSLSCSAYIYAHNEGRCPPLR